MGVLETWEGETLHRVCHLTISWGHCGCWPKWVESLGPCHGEAGWWPAQWATSTWHCGIVHLRHLPGRMILNLLFSIYLYTVEDCVKGPRPTHSPNFPKIYLLKHQENLFICFKHVDESCPPGWAPMGFFCFGGFLVCLFFVPALAVVSCYWPVLRDILGNNCCAPSAPPPCLLSSLWGWYWEGGTSFC